MHLSLAFYICYFLVSEVNFNVYALEAVCQSHREGENLEVLKLAGLWTTVYIQPSSVDCFNLHIRAITDLERESYSLKYGTFNGTVDWNKCLLEIESPLGKHYLQGTGNQSYSLENIIIRDSGKGTYELHQENANQWSLFGRHGSELLLMTDCHRDTAAIFVRACHWPAEEDLYSVLHRAGVSPLTVSKTFCEPLDYDAQRLLHQYFIKRMARG